MDFQRIREEGRFDFVTIKATEGNAYTDPDFDRNVKRAKAAGLLVGCYHFLGSTSPVVDQVKHFANVVDGVNDLKPWLDFEAPPPSKWTQQISGLYLTKRALESAQLFEHHFGDDQVVIYSYGDFMIHLPPSPELDLLGMYEHCFARYFNQKKEPTIAEWPTPPAVWRVAQWWQWSGDGGMNAPGCPGVVDHDLYYGTVDDLRGRVASDEAESSADTLPGIVLPPPPEAEGSCP